MLLPAAVQSLNNLNDQIAQLAVARPCSLEDEDEAFIPAEQDSLKKSMTLMRHLLTDAQVTAFTKELNQCKFAPSITKLVAIVQLRHDLRK